MADKMIDLTYNSAHGAITERGVTATGITAISKAASAVITVANDFVDGDTVAFSGCAGMTEINGLAAVVASASASGFTATDLNSSGFTTYTGSAGLATIVQAVTNTVRVLYDDSIPFNLLIDAIQRAKERLIELHIGA